MTIPAATDIISAAINTLSRLEKARKNFLKFFIAHPPGEKI